MPDKSALNLLDWDETASHFKTREKVSRRLSNLHDDREIGKFADLAVGIYEPAGNYSAAEHPKLQLYICQNPNWKKRVFGLADKFRNLTDANRVPQIIEEEHLNCLRIGVGSEISCMVNPGVCWVCNIRTIWLHLAWNKGPAKAEAELRLYRESASDSEMAYVKWAEDYHPILRKTLLEVVEEAKDKAKAQGLKPDGKVFLWVDAIAAYAYDSYHRKYARAVSASR